MILLIKGNPFINILFRCIFKSFLLFIYFYLNKDFQNGFYCNIGSKRVFTVTISYQRFIHILVVILIFCRIEIWIFRTPPPPRLFFPLCSTHFIHIYHCDILMLPPEIYTISDILSIAGEGSLVIYDSVRDVASMKYLTYSQKLKNCLVSLVFFKATPV